MERCSSCKHALWFRKTSHHKLSRIFPQKKLILQKENQKPFNDTKPHYDNLQQIARTTKAAFIRPPQQNVLQIFLPKILQLCQQPDHQ